MRETEIPELARVIRGLEDRLVAKGGTGITKLTVTTNRGERA